MICRITSTASRRSYGVLESQYFFSSDSSNSDATEKAVLSIFRESSKFMTVTILSGCSICLFNSKSNGNTKRRAARSFSSLAVRHTLLGFPRVNVHYLCQRFKRLVLRSLERIASDDRTKAAAVADAAQFVKHRHIAFRGIISAHITFLLYHHPIISANAIARGGAVHIGGGFCRGES